MKNLKSYLILSMIFGLSFLASNVKALEHNGRDTNIDCLVFNRDSSNTYFMLNNKKYLINDGTTNALNEFNLFKQTQGFKTNKISYTIPWTANYSYDNKKWYDIFIVFNGKFNFATKTNDLGRDAPVNVGSQGVWLDSINDDNYHAFEILLSEDDTEVYVKNSISGTGTKNFYSSGTYKFYLFDYYIDDEIQEPMYKTNWSSGYPTFSQLLKDYSTFYTGFDFPFCSLDANFTLTKEEIKDSVSEELIGEKLTAKFDKVDTDKYKYEFIDVNATDTRTEFKPGEDKTYEWFYLKNNATCVYVTDKSTNEQIGSNCEIESNLNDSKEFITFNYDESKDEYIEVDGKKILYAKYVFAKLNISPFEYVDLKNKYLFFEHYTDTKEDFGAINGATYLTENSKMNFIIVGLNTGVQYQTSVDFSKELDDVNNLPEQISWKEECNDDKTSCRVGVRFINYDEDKHQYYVSDDSEATYKQVYPRLFNKDDVGNYYFDDTEEIKTYCAEIRDGKDIISRSCYTTNGFTSTASFKSFIKRLKNFINDQTNTINHISNLIQRMYLLVDHRIRTFLETMYFLVCLIAVIWNIRR